MTTEGESTLGHFVDRCRGAGRSWSQISAALGVSKQAEHKRFSGPMADRLIERSSPALERFTPRARSVLAADKGARELHRDQVGGEHLLLGLFAEPAGIAARALTAMQVSHESVEAAWPVPAVGAAPPAPTADTTRAPASTGSAADPLPDSPDAVRALRDTVVEALEFGHNYIGTEHILLGLLGDPDAPAARLLDRLGVSPTETKVRISEMLRGLTRGAANPA